MGVDDKVVAMSFENRRFEQGVSQTRNSIAQLKKSLEFQNAGKGFDQINAAANRVHLGNIASDIDGIRSKLGFLSVAALAVFANIAAKAVTAGAQLAKSLSLDPIISGFQEYSTNLNAIQTVLANTQASGTDLNDVNSALLQLNHYSDKTIYNFGQMAKNIGTFTAAGVGLKPAVASIKGIANLAALSGSNSEQASTAMYQLSQAIASGRVSLQDWNSVVNAGMGGTVFQRALAQTAVSMGTLQKNSLKLVGPMKNVSISGQSFRESMQARPGHKSWLTSDVLTKTLQQFTGDLTDAQLAAQGFDKEQIKAIQRTAKSAEKAATEVKTISQVFSVAKETVGSGWAQTFQELFGNFNESKKTFTELSNTINHFVNTNAKARNKVLKDWKALGGRTALIEGIKTAFKNLGLILKPIRDAFHEIFPKKTAFDLFAFTLRFQQLAEAMKPSAKTVDNLKRTFKGLFALLDIGKLIISGVFNFFKKLFFAVGGGGGGFLDLTAKIGDFIVAIDETLRQGDALNKFFSKLAVVIAVPILLIKKFIGAVKDFVSAIANGTVFRAFASNLDLTTKVMTVFEAAVSRITNLWARLFDRLGIDIRPIFQKIMEGFSNFAQQIGPTIMSIVKNIHFENILEVIRTGLLVGLFLMVKKFLGKGTLAGQMSKVLGKSFRQLGGGLLKNANLGLKAWTGQMQAMQTNLKAKTLKEIAIAIALLAGALFVLSEIDPERMNPAMAAIAILFGELVGAMKVIDKFIASKGAIKLPLVAGALILLGAAINIFVLAAFALSRMNWESLKKGLAGVAILLGSVAAASIPLSKNGPGLAIAGAGTIALAIGINILALAVRQFGSMDLKQLAKGLLGVAFSLGIIADTMRAMPKSLALNALPMIALAFALNILAVAVNKFGQINWKVMVKGLAGIAGALVAIAGGMKLMPPSLPLTAAGLILVSLSLGKIAKAVATMGTMNVSTLAKGITSLGFAIESLAVGVTKMDGAASGAVALGIAAAGIALLAPALVLLGKQSGKNVAKGLGTLAAAMGVLAVAGKAITPVAPALVALGLALLAIGGGLFLAGAGIALVGVGLSAIAVAGPTAIAILNQAFIDLINNIPKFAKSLALGLIEIIDAIGVAAPKVARALINIINQVLIAIPKILPRLVKAIEALLDAFIKVLHDRQDSVIEAALLLVLALLKGLRKHTRDIVTQAVLIIKEFLLAIADQLGDIADAGFKILVALANGIGRNAKPIIDAAVKAASKWMHAFGNGLINLIDSAADTFIRFLNRLADVIETREPEVIQAFSRIGLAIVKGMAKGMISNSKVVEDAILKLCKKMLHKATHFWEVLSPSKVAARLGKNIAHGFAVGIDDHSDKAVNSITNMSQAMRDAVNRVTFGDIIETNPTITPIIDLTEVKIGAKKLSSLIDKAPLGEVSLSQASAISSAEASRAVAESTQITPGATFQFQQNNTSPKALDAVEIYRQTRNQFSTLKALVGVS